MVVAADADMACENALQRWMQEQIRTARGVRKQRLKQELSFAEMLFLRNVWWVAFGSFDHLYAQYEVRDFKDGMRYLDFAYIKNGVRLCIEIDPYGTHAQKLSRWEFDDQLDRQNDLILDDWKVLRFSLDQLDKNPRKCQQKIQQGLGKWGTVLDSSLPAHPIDQAIVKLLKNADTPLAPADIARITGWNNSTIAKHLRNLLESGFVTLAKNGQKRNTKYLINQNKK